MFLVSSSSVRIKEERVRCGLTVAQTAALSNVSVDLWEALEAGLISPGMEFIKNLRQFGFDTMYIGIGERGRRSESNAFNFMPSDTTEPDGAAADQRERIEKLVANQIAARTVGSDPFAQAVALLQRSTAAVEAFVGSGAASKSPELVAALMNATTAFESRDNMTGVAEGFTNAIDSLADSLVGALESATEAISGVEQ
jgi:transcriptional regulator with XRE-family HTH domain